MHSTLSPARAFPGTHLCDLEQCRWQTTLKWPPVMLADKGCFGEWVKRRMNYQNKKTNTPPKQTKKPTQPQSCTLQYSSVSPVERNALSKQDLTEHMALQEQQFHQLSCSNKYLNLHQDSLIWSACNNTENSYQSKVGYKRTPSIIQNHFVSQNNQNNTQRAFPSTALCQPGRKMNSEFCTRWKMYENCLILWSH